MKPWAEAELIACHKALFLSLNSLQFSYSYCLFGSDCGIISMSNSWPQYPLQAVRCSQLIAEIQGWSVPFAFSYRSLVLLQRRNCFTAGHVPGLPVATSPRSPGTSAGRLGPWDKPVAVPWLHNCQHSVRKCGAGFSWVVLVAAPSSLFWWAVLPVSVLWAVRGKTSTREASLREGWGDRVLAGPRAMQSRCSWGSGSTLQARVRIQTEVKS